MQTSIQGLSDRALLIIMDGFGFNPSSQSNAIKAAKTPNLDYLFSHYPFTTIQPGGEAVGLPKGVAGNSEVGHLNLGAGRPVRQDLVRINEAIELNQFENLPRLNELIQKAKNGTKRIHLMGLLSDGGVHSHINHLKVILKILKKHTDLNIFLHAFMDGRDTSKNKGIEYVKDILTIPGFTFSSMQGRSIGMDRDRRWEKIELAYKTLIGEGKMTQKSPEDYVRSEYEGSRFDEFISPVLFTKEGAIQDGDSIFFFNYRPDRAKQITLAFNDKNFKEFQVHVKPGYYLCMTPYVPDECPDLPVLFDKEKIRGGLAEYISSLNKKQFKIAETEKYAHVTYFFNGGEETPFPGEERCLVPSPREVSTYDEKPEMSAQIVTEKLIEKLADSSITLFVVNFANPDMVGHTGNFEAAVKAIEALDDCIGKVTKKCSEEKIAVVITADHGNADVMKYEDGSPHTSHSDSLVPFCIVHPKLIDQKMVLNHFEEFALKDVAPTLIHILNFPKPESFSGNSIFN